MTQSGVHLQWFRSHMKVAAAKGLDTDALILKYASHLDLQDEQAVLTTVEQLTVVLDMMVSLGDESHGYARTPVPVGYNALVLRNMMSAGTVAEALELTCRFLRVTGSPIKMFLQCHVTHTDIFLRMEEGVNRAASLEEIWIRWMEMCLSWLIGEPVKPLAALTTDTCSAVFGGQHGLRAVPVVASSSTGLRLARATLNMPIIKRSESYPVCGAVKFFVEHAIDTSSPALAMDVGGTQIMPQSKAIRLKELCNDLSISASTLRRRLNAEGLSFRALRQEAVVAAVCERLIVSNDTGELLAERVGFAEARSLRRMIKSATGMTLQELRTRVTEPMPKTDDKWLRLRCLEFARLLDG